MCLPLSFAAQSDQDASALAMLERLLVNGADARASDYDERTGLHIAAAAGATKACGLLRASGADPLQVCVCVYPHTAMICATR